METRNIIIVDSESNQKVVVNTDATTFGELKRAASAAGINYEGKDWLEGITKTTPMSDDSLLPVNVMFKGKMTNNLVYMITNTNSKFKNGADRAELYHAVKSRGLQEDIKATFGKNYTQVKSSELEAYLDNINASIAQEVAETADGKYKEKYEKTIKTLATFLSAFPADVMLDINNSLVENVQFSAEEIEKMFI